MRVQSYQLRINSCKSGISSFIPVNSPDASSFLFFSHNTQFHIIRRDLNSSKIFVVRVLGKSLSNKLEINEINTNDTKQ